MDNEYSLIIQLLDNIIKTLLKEIKELLGKLNENSPSTKEIVEAAAAKIISEMKNCPCNREILDALNSKESEKTIIPKTENKEKQSK